MLNSNTRKYLSLLLLSSLTSLTITQTTLPKDCNLSSYSVLECYQQCRIIYQGTKNYFNSTSGFCGPVTSCLSNQEYNYLTNSCSFVVPDYSSFPNNTLINSSANSSSLNGSLTAPKINCINGYLISNTSICICYSGWTDVNPAGVQVVQKCNSIIPGFSNTTSQNGTTNSTNSSTITYSSTATNSSNISSINVPTPQIQGGSIITQTSSISTIYIIIACVAFFCVLSTCYCCYKKLKNRNSENFDYEADIRNLERHKTIINAQPRYIPTIHNQREFNGNQINALPFDYSSECIVDNYPERVNRQLTFHTPVKKRNNIYLTNNRVQAFSDLPPKRVINYDLEDDISYLPVSREMPRYLYQSDIANFNPGFTQVKSPTRREDLSGTSIYYTHSPPNNRRMRTEAPVELNYSPEFFPRTSSRVLRTQDNIKYISNRY